MPNPMIALGSMGFDTLMTLLFNRLQRGWVEQAAGGLKADTASALDKYNEQTARYQDPSYWNALPDAPGFTLGGQVIQRPGETATGDPARQFGLEGLFGTTGPGAEETYGTAFGDLIERMRKDYASAMPDSEGMASTVGGLFSDAETDAFERSGLIESGLASKARLGQAMTGAAAGALGRGRNLSEIADLQGLMEMQEGEARSMTAADIQAAAEKIRNETALARSGAQAEAYGLGKQMENLTGRESAFQTGQFGLNKARDLMQARLADIETGNIDQEQIWRAFDEIMSGKRWAASNEANMAAGFATTGLGTQSQSDLAAASLLGGFQFNQPMSYPYANMFMQASASQPKSGGTGVSVLFISASSGGCIDASAKVLTKDGDKCLLDVMPGDSVLSNDGNYYPVVAKDCGLMPLDERKPMIQIRHGLDIIVATADHVVNGIPAGEWDHTQLVPYRVSADLMLEDNHPYLCNGFVVESNIGKMGLGKWAEFLRAKNDHDGNKMEVRSFIHDAENPCGGWAKLET